MTRPSRATVPGRVRALAATALVAAVASPAAVPAQAERLVLSVSQPQVHITSSFTGADLVVFGVAEGADDRPVDVVVTVRGPAETFTTWRKSRMLGLWVNTDSRTFMEVPAFLSVLTSRPAEAMASPQTLRIEQIGLSRNILVQRVGPDYADVVPSDPFRAAFVRIQEQQGLYREDPAGVTFIAPGVFRAEVSIPGTAPLGRYTIAAKVLQGGVVMASQLSAFDVQKTGFEQKIAELSQHDGLLYGLVVALGSLVVGFFGNLLFRRE